jgi:transposase
MEIATVLEKVLNVEEPWEIQEVEVKHSANVLRIKIDYLKESKFSCPKCGEESLVHDGKYREWRYLDFMQYKTYLEIKIPRTKCEKCGVLTIKDLPFARTNSHYSFF